MKYWKSEYTGEIYGMDDDWMPKAGCRGWTLLHDAPTTNEKEEENQLYLSIRKMKRLEKERNEK